jgi:hypothetical protein
MTTPDDSFTLKCTNKNSPYNRAVLRGIAMGLVAPCAAKVIEVGA